MIVSSQYSRTERLMELASELEKLLQRIVNDYTYIGVGYGVTLDRAVEYMNIQGKKEVKVVPLLGGYSRLFDSRHSNNISKVLAEKFDGISYTVHAPALVDSREIRDSIQKDSAVKEIYNLIKRVTVAIICMSDLSKESTLYKAGQLNEDDINYLTGQGIIGDINYIFVDKDGNPVQSEISERQIILFPPEDIRKIKNVIALIVGARKAEILKAALTGGYINILFCDEDAVSMLDL